MLNMSTMSYIKLSITVFQEQQNGETNTLRLLSTSRHCWAMCGGSWPKPFGSVILSSDTPDSVSPRCELHPEQEHGHPDPRALWPYLPCPILQALPRLLVLHTQHTSLLRLTLATPGWGQTVVQLFSSNYFFSLRIIFQAIPPGRKV